MRAQRRGRGELPGPLAQEPSGRRRKVRRRNGASSGPVPWDRRRAEQAYGPAQSIFPLPTLEPEEPIFSRMSRTARALFRRRGEVRAEASLPMSALNALYGCSTETLADSALKVRTAGILESIGSVQNRVISTIAPRRSTPRLRPPLRCSGRSSIMWATVLPSSRPAASHSPRARSSQCRSWGSCLTR